MTKSEIRCQIKQRQAQLPAGTKAEWSRAICRLLLDFPPFQSARSMGAYEPLGTEVDISPLFALDDKRFFVPVHDSERGGYRLARRTEIRRAGRFGIPEPIHPVFAQPDEPDLILVPGIAFDPCGHRIGRGQGFYDRMLPDYPAKRVGICFDFQLQDTLPTQEHDCRMDYIVCQSKIIVAHNEH